MATIEEGNVQVFVFREGALSRFGHDLRLTLESFTVRVDGDRVSGRFFPGSLRVDGAVKDGGRLDDKALSARDRAHITENIREQVLHTERYPEVMLEATAEQRSDGAELQGRLELHGRTAPVTVPVRRRDGRLTGEVELVPSRWGVRPYRAALGALRVKDRVVVRFDLREPSSG